MAHRRHRHETLVDLLERAQHGRVVLTCRSVRDAESLRNALYHEQRTRPNGRHNVTIEWERTRLALFVLPDPILHAQAEPGAQTEN